MMTAWPYTALALLAVSNVISQFTVMRLSRIAQKRAAELHKRCEELVSAYNRITALANELTEERQRETARLQRETARMHARLGVQR